MRTVTQSRCGETLIGWWDTEHEILASVVDRIPEERLEASCIVGDDAPVIISLQFLIEDYLRRHQRGHAKHLNGEIAS